MYFEKIVPLACARYPVQAPFSTANFSLDSTFTMKSNVQAFLTESTKQTVFTSAVPIHGNVDLFFPTHPHLLAEEMNLPDTGASALNLNSFASDDHPEDWEACFIDINDDVSDQAQTVQISSNKIEEDKPVASADNAQSEMFEALQSFPSRNQESIESLQVEDALESKCALEAVEVTTTASAADSSEEYLDASMSLTVEVWTPTAELHLNADGEDQFPDSFVCAFSFEFRENEVGRLSIWAEEQGSERIVHSLPVFVPELKWIVEHCPVLAELSWNEQFWVMAIRVGETFEILYCQEEFDPTWDEHLRLMLENFIHEVHQIVLGREFWVSEIWSKPEIITLSEEGIA